MQCINAKDNHKNSIVNTKCELCEIDDTTEHLFECTMLQRLTQEEMKVINLESVGSM